MLDILKDKGTVVCRLPGKKKTWGLFRSPLETITAYRIPEVIPALYKLEDCLKKGFYVAGFISYEASSAFDPANRTNKLNGFPLVWLSAYKNFSPLKLPASTTFNQHSVILSPEIGKDIYLKHMKRIKKYIYDGDIYQANYTFRTTGKKPDNPELLFLSLFRSHPVPYSAFVNTGNLQLISNSPELFLESISGKIRSLPMKGTASRALTCEEDRKVSENLSNDLKNRAENIMIVDMVRNDLGRICRTGSVKADDLFHVDTYPTVHQMVSEVTGRLKAGTSVSNILSAVFPPASITGAPKIRAMEIISELEKSPRKAYTGSIGCFLPNGDLCLNVAIRTFICSGRKMELGIGSGIVADSEPGKEYDECLMKKNFANFATPEFKVLETILWEKGKGLKHVKEHLERARDSQMYFGRKWNAAKVSQALKRLISNLTSNKIKRARCRLLVSQDGRAETEFAVLEKPGWGKDLLKIKLSNRRTDSKDVFLYHKTTNRKFYDEQFRKAHSEGFDEVIFLNEKDELTEGAITNVFILEDGQWLTPALACGLLPGIWRRKMIRRLHAKEVRITAVDLKQAGKIIIGNSVRGGGEAKLTADIR